MDGGMKRKPGRKPKEVSPLPEKMEVKQPDWKSPIEELPQDMQHVLICLKRKYIRPSIDRDWLGWIMADTVFQDMAEVWDKMPAEHRSQYGGFQGNFYKIVGGRFIWHGQGNNKFAHDDVMYWLPMPEGPNGAK